MWRPGGLCRQEADRKSPPSQPGLQWRQEAVRSAEGAGAGLEGAGAAPEGAEMSPAEAAPGKGSYSSVDGPPGRTPAAPSPSAARRSRLPARLFPPPGCPSPVGGHKG